MCLLSVLPDDITGNLKAIIKATEAGNQTTCYKRIKDSNLQTFGPKQGEYVAKAAGLVLTGKPSMLAREIIGLY